MQVKDDSARRASDDPSSVVTDEMVSRFLTWRLPDDFAPDCGVSFTKPNHPTSWPVGTNLLTAIQARQMLEYVLSGQEQEGKA